MTINPKHQQLSNILDRCKFQLSTLEPSEWAEANMRITVGNFQGSLDYSLTPYWRKVVNTLSPYSGFPEVTLMGGAQIGKSKTVIEPILCYYISEHPCNIGFLTGHTDLSEESIIELDSAIRNAGIHHLIKSQSPRVRNSRTGDTNNMKEYPMGKLVAGSASNHKLLRQRNWKFTVADDLEAAPKDSKKSGDTVSLIRLRSNSYGKNKKIFWCSTPELVENSLIEPLYLSGNQQRWFIPCQCCGEMITLEWEVLIDEREKAGIRWVHDEHTGLLKRGSVEYVCQKCGGAFKENNKHKFLNDGDWIATNDNPSNPDMASFHISGLYAGVGFDSWEVLVREYLEANPLNGQRIDKKHQTFVNLRLGLSHTSEVEEVKSTDIMSNTRKYKPFTVPEQQSIEDGNGRIILLTLGADLNGKMRGYHGWTEDDVRLDWEIVAHSYSGSTYSIAHGSIGTFQRGISDDVQRVKWTAQHGDLNCIWPELDKILDADYIGDNDVVYRIFQAGVDTGAYNRHVYAYLDRTLHRVVGVRGQKEDRYKRDDENAKLFQVGQQRKDEYFLQVGYLKDDIANCMKLGWDRKGEQPPNFMNFPQPSNGMYTFDAYFNHFQAEARKIKENGECRWEKKKDHNENHLWDCHVYNRAIRAIEVYNLGQELKRAKKIDPTQPFTWGDYAHYMDVSL
jgi:phage terminase large subunit GpA-like protein